MNGKHGFEILQVEFGGTPPRKVVGDKGRLPHWEELRSLMATLASGPVEQWASVDFPTAKMANSVSSIVSTWVAQVNGHQKGWSMTCQKDPANKQRVWIAKVVYTKNGNGK